MWGASGVEIVWMEQWWCGTQGVLPVDEPMVDDYFLRNCNETIPLQSLVGLSTSVGPPQPDLLVTIHVVIRPFSAEKSLQGILFFGADCSGVER